jgi:hypothetical protein
MNLRPYRKAIVSGVLAAIVVAAQFYHLPALQVAAALVSPLAVYLAKNEVPA